MEHNSTNKINYTITSHYFCSSLTRLSPGFSSFDFQMVMIGTYFFPYWRRFMAQQQKYRTQTSMLMKQSSLKWAS